MGKLIKLLPIHCPKVWGYENWIASTHPDGCQKDFLAAAGDYPLLVKIIQADSPLSVQVHPDDKAAAQLEGKNARGKTECWYVLDAAPDGAIIYGLKDSYKADELQKAIKMKTLEEKLRKVSVKKGDFAFIPAGTVHAICGGVRLLEVQQNCNITYRLYDWGRPRELHIKKALQSIQHANLPPLAPMADSFACDYFSLKRITIAEDYRFLEADTSNEKEGWHLLFMVSGRGRICASGKEHKAQETIAFEGEDLFALAPKENIQIEGKCEMISITLP